MTIPFIDLHAQHQPIRAEIDRAIAEVLDSGQFIRGPFVRRFEEKVAEYVGVKHAIGVSSGTDALLASLMALGVGPGDEVITTPFTFCASAECILRVGAEPVFVDIDPATFNLDAGLVTEAVTDRTRAILPVHLFGQCCDMDAIMDVARAHDLFVVEDCAQAMGAKYRGQQAGSMGDVGCFSFFPTKNLGGVGDGGMITCDDDALAERIRVVCSHGCAEKYDQVMAGGNFRLDAIQAAVLDVKLEHLNEWIGVRRQNARAYDEALAGVEGVVTPVEAEGCWHTYNQYTVRVDDREAVCGRLKDAGVGFGVYYRKGLQAQAAYEGVRCVPEGLGVTEMVCGEVVSLPVGGEQIAVDLVARTMS
ncbi:DegT/DnrJ/EryC1/StrS family aminotransferase [Persicimonas caeni]|uniref:DegT/DnrJ/EryC1/StrS family aminotransferase n=1 Tax=Persicimonas caeni TaxID=2292766 RepID=A0A4Y6PTQ6_PERCE|nr:DegT/DnrJ/EryC1/StrS family aminotransferase [Persicimonas caeni]QDG51714.1 DegT/DnrJ/EryC1/StrS family aminotransferase [Persicimonas caeni]QED32935.1 DegT/DnrJ/EryC1/StrS family aminotransferase [Persicimonas caeni]